MTLDVRFSQLSPARQRLVRLCQALNFGSILNLTITRGEVSFEPQPQVLFDVRLDQDAAARSETELCDFTLCAEVCRLMRQIDAVENGAIDAIVVHAGVPRRITIRRPL